jgi:hypothetical protein
LLTTQTAAAAAAAKLLTNNLSLFQRGTLFQNPNLIVAVTRYELSTTGQVRLLHGILFVESIIERNIRLFGKNRPSLKFKCL